jgi:amidase
MVEPNRHTLEYARMTPEELGRYDGCGLAQLIHKKTVSALEVVDAAIAAIEQQNDTLNAVISRRYDEAREEAKTVSRDAPFAGVPFLVKDLNTWVEGLPATNGSRALQNFFPPFQSELIARYRKAGLIILGKTNTPEFGLNVTTEPELFGSARNPFDLSRSTGGSSGGSAAAVAAKMVPFAHATDSGGSIRIPASNCGLFGLKPTRARVPLGNNAPEGISGFSTAHAVTHSVRDSARLLEIAAGPLPGDPYAAPALPDTLSHDGSGGAKLRIALTTQGFAGEAIHMDCANAAQRAGELLETMGHDVVLASPKLDGEALLQAYDVMFTSNIAAMVGALPEEARWLVEPATRSCAAKGARYSAPDYVKALATIHASARVMGQFFDTYDVLLTPTLANPPLPLGTLNMSDENWDDYWPAVVAQIPFTPLFNATGSPAASVPFGMNKDGLPIGIQIGAASGRETTLLHLAAELEVARPWWHA